MTFSPSHTEVLHHSDFGSLVTQGYSQGKLLHAGTGFTQCLTQSTDKLWGTAFEPFLRLT